MTTHCHACAQDKPLDDFYRSRGKVHKPCKECRRSYSRRRYAANPREVRLGMALAKYGLSRQQFDELLEQQDHSCAICRKAISVDSPRSLHIDHDAATGAVRGLLCDMCNPGIGFLKHDPEVLRAAIAYLDAPPMLDVLAPGRVVRPVA